MFRAIIILAIVGCERQELASSAATTTRTWTLFRVVLSNLQCPDLTALSGSRCHSRSCLVSRRIGSAASPCRFTVRTAMLDYYLPPLVATACSQLLLRLIFGAVLTRQSTRIMGAFYTRHLRYSHAPKHRNQCLVRLGRSLSLIHI